MEVTVRAHMPDGTLQEISHAEIVAIAKALGLDDLVPRRYSSVLVMDLVNLESQGVPAHYVLSEIRALELGRATQTKLPSPFKNSSLKNLWHKHFFYPSPSTLVKNSFSEFGKDGLDKIVTRICDPEKNDYLTQELINQLSHAITIEPFETRWKERRLTGEWLIYSPNAEGNIYLGACPHSIGDTGLVARKQIWDLEFPSLAA